MIKTDLKGLPKAFARINAKIAKTEDIATTRTLNIIAKEEKQDIADNVNLTYGVLKGSAKKHIGIKRATKEDKNVSLNISSTRTNLVDPKKIKDGISFRSKGVRKKVKVAVKTGSSKPFTIRAKAGGQTGGDDIQVRGGKKMIPVYVSKAFNKFKSIAQRKVTTMKGHSLKVMVEKIYFDPGKLLEKAIKKKFSKIYPKQLEKAKFTGSR
jgi:hypothetical protein